MRLNLLEFKYIYILKQKKRPGSSVVEHLHGKQVVVGSIPILGKSRA